MYMEFYETLERLMRERGITAAELARRTGIRPSYFSDLKHGRAKDVTWDKAFLIFRALEMSPNDFAREQGYDFEDSKCM